MRVQPIPVSPWQANCYLVFTDEDASECLVVDPPVCCGPEHPERKRLVFARQRRLRATLAKTGKVPVSDPEEDEAEELDTLVACTLGWAGASEAFSRDAVRRLYAKKRWLRDQVAAALQERELFIRACVQA